MLKKNTLRGLNSPQFTYLPFYCWELARGSLVSVAESRSHGGALVAVVEPRSPAAAASAEPSCRSQWWRLGITPSSAARADTRSYCMPSSGGSRLWELLWAWSGSQAPSPSSAVGSVVWNHIRFGSRWGSCGRGKKGEGRLSAGRKKEDCLREG